MGAVSFDEGFARLRKAASGVPDRVPVTAQLHELAMAWTGMEPARMFSDAGTLIDAIFRTAGDFGFDVPNLSYDVYNTELEAMGHRIEILPRSTPVLDPGRVLLTDHRLDRLRRPEPGERRPHALCARRAAPVPGAQRCRAGPAVLRALHDGCPGQGIRAAHRGRAPGPGLCPRSACGAHRRGDRPVDPGSTPGDSRRRGGHGRRRPVLAADDRSPHHRGVLDPLHPAPARALPGPGGGGQLVGRQPGRAAGELSRSQAPRLPRGDARPGPGPGPRRARGL